jgi:hypothetical protein
MSSRQEEKERRRQERLAREAEAAEATRRRKLVGYASGGVLVVAIVVAVVVAVAGGGGGKTKTPTTAKPPAKTAPIPAAKLTSLDAAVKAAGCRLQTFIPGPADREHVTGSVTYKQNPPVFGPHYPIPLSDGDYAHGAAPQTERAVHALEHGRVDIWFKPTLPANAISQLETLFNEPIAQGAPKAYKQLLIPRPDMPSAVAASAWGQQLTCPKFNAKVFDALRAFRKAFVDHAPESQIPFPE